MSGMTRRRLLQVGAGAGVAALSADPLVQLAMSRKLPPGKLSDIEHVVILIQENRSFDHYFGMMPGVRGFSDPTAPKSVFEQPGYEEPGYNGVLMPFHAPSSMGAGGLCFPDITHSWVPQHQAWDNGAMDGFWREHLAFDGAAAAPAAMAYYEREDLPSTGSWRKTSRSATTTTARSSGRRTRTACTACRAPSTPTAKAAARWSRR